MSINDGSEADAAGRTALSWRRWAAAVCLMGPFAVVALAAPLPAPAASLTSTGPFAQLSTRLVRISLEEAVARVRSVCPGQLLDASLRNDVYTIRWKSRDQKVVIFRVDAETGRILSGRC